jgi:hypothetical protein
MHESTLVQIRGTTARLAEEHLEYIAGLLLAASLALACLPVLPPQLSKPNTSANYLPVSNVTPEL